MVGTDGCTWSMAYPDQRDVESDLSKGALYCMRGPEEKILGLISVDEDELCAAQLTVFNFLLHFFDITPGQLIVHCHIPLYDYNFFSYISHS